MLHGCCWRICNCFLAFIFYSSFRWLCPRYLLAISWKLSEDQLYIGCVLDSVVLQVIIQMLFALSLPCSLAYALILFINRISFLFSFSFYTFNILLVLFVIAGECPQLLFLYLQTNGIACLAHWSFSFRIIYINIEYIIKEIAGRLTEG